MTTCFHRSQHIYASVGAHSMYCSYCDLKNLPDISICENLAVLSCSGNKLKYLPNLPQRLRELYCSNNLLRRLPYLPKTLRVLYCRKNKLRYLPILPLALKTLNCSNNKFHLTVDSVCAIPSLLDLCAQYVSYHCCEDIQARLWTRILCECGRMYAINQPTILTTDTVFGRLPINYEYCWNCAVKKLWACDKFVTVV